MELRYTGDLPKENITEMFGKCMEELINQDSKVVYLDADLMGSLKIQELWKKRPDRVFNCGIQEANMVGVAAGLYLAGYKPYIHSFAPFITRRVFDQLFISIAYAHKSVHLIGSDVGIMATDNGGTHMCFEDVALIRTIPGACIVDVTDSVMFKSLLKNTKDREGVTYFRTPRRNAPDIYLEDENFNVGEGKVLVDGTEVTVIASGIMVSTALTASTFLRQEGISVRVVDPITIKPIDKKLILKCAKETGAIITVENHNIIGGLGGAVSEIISEEFPVPVLKIGVNDSFGQVGTEAYLREQYGLKVENIIEKVHLAINIKKRTRKEC